MEIKNTERVQNVLRHAHDDCVKQRNEFLTPEHLLVAMVMNDNKFYECIVLYGKTRELVKELDEQIAQMPKVAEAGNYEPELSMQMQQLIEKACIQVFSSNGELLDVTHMVAALLQLEDSWAAYLLKELLGGEESIFMSNLIEAYEQEDEWDEELNDISDSNPFEEDRPKWQQLVTCLNDVAEKGNPLIGREKELERTIQVLCRKDKNNPLHVGEAGVGKTALVYGLTRRIIRGDVPERLKGCKVYLMDMGTMLAGTHYRGDFERRIQQVMEGVKKEGKAIIYIDEIHNMIGAGSNDGTNDASNMLKPYLEQGDIRFIGSTTYDEYNRYFAKSKGIVRRFQQIDIAEPSIKETIDILKGLRKRYEEFHNVTYSDEVIEYAVRQSAKLISDRFLPDKAIDLIDEAGAAHQLSPSTPTTHHPSPITPKDIQLVLEKTCKIDAAALKDDNNEQLETLRERILSRIYGQDEAVSQVVEAIQMSKAGLSDDDKPLASLLFVGPTGVGKTEVARVLAQELGIELVRFDMSEYTEKHAVAKLIGSPAGYVGYEDGGQLTDAIRKSPNCVLLLDELEKAHQDIYNILLQVMDYARLTDNKGRKADFRNVVVIMTSNAGAQFAGQTIGFEKNTSRGEAMMKQVKRTFKPEFINRLSGTVVFHDMDMKMAGMILDKKLRELQQKLSAKKVTMTLSDAARQLLLQKGFTQEYGAREMNRVIAQMLKPLLMREILFGSLRQGGAVTVSTNPDQTLCLAQQAAPPMQ